MKGACTRLVDIVYVDSALADDSARMTGAVRSSTPREQDSQTAPCVMGDFLGQFAATHFGDRDRTFVCPKRHANDFFMHHAIAQNSQEVAHRRVEKL